MNPASLIPFILPLLIFAALFAAVLFSHKQIANNGVPSMQMWARVISIKPAASPDAPFCTVTFADAAAQKFTLQVSAAICGSLIENDIGSLHFQGTRFISFEPIRS